MDPPPSDPVEQVERKDTKKIRIVLALLGLMLIILIAVVAYWVGRPNNAATTQNTASPSTPLAPAKIQLALLANGLPNPTNIVSTNQTGDRRLFVTDEAGVIRIVNPDSSVAGTPFLDISGQVLFSGEMGLLGLAFSPHYDKDHYFFINYIDKGQNTIIARYRVSADINKADPASGQILLTLKQPYMNHNGGDLVFGADGYLYATLGDGGSAGDPQNRAQNLSSLFGKILRLDVSQVPYKIPVNNPFANQSGKAGEIWDYGLRNPWKISFDRKTNDLYIADVGQGKAEEVDFEAAGGKGGNNYGWRCFEGSLDYNLDGCGPREQYLFPVLTYDHSENRCSITGGLVYRGQRYPALRGKYFYGDYCGGQLYWAEKAGNQWKSELATATTYQITAMGEDSQGEIYLADTKTGSIYQVKDSAN